MDYNNLQDADKRKMLFEAQVKTAKELAEIKKLLRELVEKINKGKK